MRRLLLAMALALASCAPKAPSSPASSSPASVPVERVESVEPLARAFDAAHGKPRFVTVLSPT